MKKVVFVLFLLLYGTTLLSEGGGPTTESLKEFVMPANECRWIGGDCF
ncbi:hypothetical protein SCOR_06930 [Sulfidibacter corallicola]